LKTRIIESNSFNPWFNLALEEYLFKNMEPSTVILYLWQNQNTVVIGKTQNAFKECRCELLEEDGGFLARRPSGGGAVYQDLGNMCFTFMASSNLYNLERQLSVILEAVREQGIDATFSGRNDIVTVDGRKFSGNAFTFYKDSGLQHGTILMDTDSEKMAKYLRASQAKMRSKGVDSVRSRVVNLITLNPSITIEKIKDSFKKAFIAKYTKPEKYMIYSEEDKNSVTELNNLYEKYSSWEWRYGSNPEFEISHEARFTWGEIEISLSCKNGLIDSAKVYSDAMDPSFTENINSILPGTAYTLQGIKNALKQVVELSGYSKDIKNKINEISEWVGADFF
jgi:lipoate-protein ligase A